MHRTYGLVSSQLPLRTRTHPEYTMDSIGSSACVMLSTPTSYRIQEFLENQGVSS